MTDHEFIEFMKELLLAPDSVIKKAHMERAVSIISGLQAEVVKWRDMCEDCNCIKVKETVIGELVEKNKALQLRNDRWVNDVNITEACLGISGLYATKDKQIDELQARIKELEDGLAEWIKAQCEGTIEDRTGNDNLN